MAEEIRIDIGRYFDRHGRTPSGKSTGIPYHQPAGYCQGPYLRSAGGHGVQGGLCPSI